MHSNLPFFVPLIVFLKYFVLTKFLMRIALQKYFSFNSLHINVLHNAQVCNARLLKDPSSSGDQRLRLCC